MQKKKNVGDFFFLINIVCCLVRSHINFKTTYITFMKSVCIHYDILVSVTKNREIGSFIIHI